MVVGGLLIKAAGRLRAEVEAATGGAFAEHVPPTLPRAHGPLRIDQRFEPYPGVGFDDATYRGDAYPAFGWAACVAQVEVDLDTGEVRVRDVVAADDIGHVIHPVLAEGQVEGGTLQAVGYATIEEIKLRDGRYLNDRLATYIIPTRSMPRGSRRSSSRRRSPVVPHGAKGVGELPMDVGAPAVIAAIADATGVWISELPASPERILAALSGVAAVAPLPPGASEAARVTTYRFTVNGEAVELDVPGMRRLLDVAARGPRPDRHEGGLRRGRVRRLHGAARRGARGRLSRPGLPGRGSDRPDRRRAGAGAAGDGAASTRSRPRSSRPAAPSAGSARPGC